MTATNGNVERKLWAAADELRANSRLKASEYSMPVLGLIFLRYADVKSARVIERQHRNPGTDSSVCGQDRAPGDPDIVDGVRVSVRLFEETGLLSKKVNNKC